MSFVQVWEGQWLKWERKERWACCDCLLIHKVEVRVRKGQLEVRMFRDNRATGQARRHAKVKARKRKGKK